MRLYFADRTIGCPACQYNLRGVASEKCPECGVPLRLHLDTTDLRLGPWMLGVLAVAMPLGFSFILGVIAAIGGWRAVTNKGTNVYWLEPWTQHDTITLAALGGLSAFYFVWLMIIIRRRAKFLTRSRGEQWLRSFGLILIMASLQAALLYVWTRMTNA